MASAVLRLAYGGGKTNIAEALELARENVFTMQ